MNLVKLLPKGFPVLATTATATKRVELDIAEQIGNNIFTIRGNLMRDNFKLFVVKVSSEDEKLIWLGKYLTNYQVQEFFIQEQKLTQKFTLNGLLI